MTYDDSLDKLRQLAQPAPLPSTGMRRRADVAPTAYGTDPTSWAGKSMRVAPVRFESGWEALTGGLKQVTGNKDAAIPHYRRSKALDEEAARRGPEYQDPTQVADAYRQGGLGKALGAGLQYIGHETIQTLPDMALSAVGAIAGGLSAGPGGAVVGAGTGMARRLAGKAVGKKIGKMADDALYDAVLDPSVVAQQGKDAAVRMAQAQARTIAPNVAAGAAANAGAAKAAKELAERRARVLGQFGGAIPGTMAPITRGSREELEATDQEGAAKILSANLAASALGSIATLRYLGQATGGLATKEIAEKSAPFLQRLAAGAKRSAKTGQIEGFTETGQELIQNLGHKWVDENVEVLSPEALQNYLLAYGIGSIIGTGIGGGIEVAGGSGRVVGDAAKATRARVSEWAAERRKAMDSTLNRKYKPGEPMDDAPNPTAQRFKDNETRLSIDDDVERYMADIDQMFTDALGKGEPKVGLDAAQDWRAHRTARQAVVEAVGVKDYAQLDILDRMVVQMLSGVPETSALWEADRGAMVGAVRNLFEGKQTKSDMQMLSAMLDTPQSRLTDSMVAKWVATSTEPHVKDAIDALRKAGPTLEQEADPNTLGSLVSDDQRAELEAMDAAGGALEADASRPETAISITDPTEAPTVLDALGEPVAERFATGRAVVSNPNYVRVRPRDSAEPDDAKVYDLAQIANRWRAQNASGQGVPLKQAVLSVLTDMQEQGIAVDLDQQGARTITLKSTGETATFTEAEIAALTSMRDAEKPKARPDARRVEGAEAEARKAETARIQRIMAEGDGVTEREIAHADKVLNRFGLANLGTAAEALADQTRVVKGKDAARVKDYIEAVRRRVLPDATPEQLNNILRAVQRQIEADPSYDTDVGTPGGNRARAKAEAGAMLAILRQTARNPKAEGMTARMFKGLRKEVQEKLDRAEAELARDNLSEKEFKKAEWDAKSARRRLKVLERVERSVIDKPRAEDAIDKQEDGDRSEYRFVPREAPPAPITGMTSAVGNVKDVLISTKWSDATRGLEALIESMEWLNKVATAVGVDAGDITRVNTTTIKGRGLGLVVEALDADNQPKRHFMPLMEPMSRGFLDRINANIKPLEFDADGNLTGASAKQQGSPFKQVLAPMRGPSLGTLLDAYRASQREGKRYKFLVKEGKQAEADAEIETAAKTWAQRDPGARAAMERDAINQRARLRLGHNTRAAKQTRFDIGVEIGKILIRRAAETGSNQLANKQLRALVDPDSELAMRYYNEALDGKHDSVSVKEFAWDADQKNVDERSRADLERLLVDPAIGAAPKFVDKMSAFLRGLMKRADEDTRREIQKQLDILNDRENIREPTNMTKLLEVFVSRGLVDRISKLRAKYAETGDAALKVEGEALGALQQLVGRLQQYSDVLASPKNSIEQTLEAIYTSNARHAGHKRPKKGADDTDFEMDQVFNAKSVSEATTRRIAELKEDLLSANKLGDTDSAKQLQAELKDAMRGVPAHIRESYPHRGGLEAQLRADHAQVSRTEGFPAKLYAALEFTRAKASAKPTKSRADQLADAKRAGNEKLAAKLQAEIDKASQHADFNPVTGERGFSGRPKLNDKGEKLVPADGLAPRDPEAERAKRDLRPQATDVQVPKIDGPDPKVDPKPSGPDRSMVDADGVPYQRARGKLDRPEAPPRPEVAAAQRKLAEQRKLSKEEVLEREAAEALAKKEKARKGRAKAQKTRLSEGDDTFSKEDIEKFNAEVKRLDLANYALRDQLATMDKKSAQYAEVAAKREALGEARAEFVKANAAMVNSPEMRAYNEAKREDDRRKGVPQSGEWMLQSQDPAYIALHRKITAEVAEASLARLQEMKRSYKGRMKRYADIDNDPHATTDDYKIRDIMASELSMVEQRIAELEASPTIEATATQSPDLKRDQQLINETLASMGITVPVKLTDVRPDDTKANADGSQKGDVIYINPRLEGAKRVEVIMHELGHFIVDQEWKNASPETKAALIEDYKKWRRSQRRKNLSVKGRNAIQIRISRAPTTIASTLEEALVKLKKDRGLKKVPASDAESIKYALSFHEYLADHISRKLTSDKRSTTVIGKFFEDVAKQLRALYDKIFKRHSKHAPAKSVDAWINQLYDRDVSAVQSVTGSAVPQESARQIVLNTPQGIIDAIKYALSPATRQLLYEQVSTGRVTAMIAKHFKDDPDAIKRWNSASDRIENRIAMAFDLFRHRQAKFGAEAEHLFIDELGQMMLNITGIASDGYLAGRVFDEMLDGRLAAAKAKGDAYDIRTRVTQGFTGAQKARNQAWANVRKITGSMSKVITNVLDSKYDRANASGIPMFVKVASLLTKHTGDIGDDIGAYAAVRNRTAIMARRFDTAMHHIDRDKQLDVINYLQSYPDDTVQLASQPQHVQDAVKKVRPIMRDMYDYLRANGVIPKNTRITPERFWPIVMKFDAESDNAASLRRILSKPEYAAEIEAFFKDKNDKLTPEQRIENLVAGAAGIELESKAADDLAPAFKGSNFRLMQFIYEHGSPQDVAEFAKLQTKNVDEIFSSYFIPAVRNAEYTKRFGGGEKNRGKLDAMLKEMKQQGATDKQVRDAEAMVEAFTGSYGANGSPVLAQIAPGLAAKLSGRKTQHVMQGVMAYQNIRLLPLAIVSQFIEPIGIAVRAGDFGLAYKGFKAGIQSAFNGAGRDRMERMSDWLQMADDMVVWQTMQGLYGSADSGFAKGVNEFTFKWNALNWSTQAIRNMAAITASEFLIEHKRHPTEASNRYLAELNIDPSEIVLDGDGKLKMYSEFERTQMRESSDPAVKAELVRDAKVRSAVIQFIDEAVIRPNPQQTPQWFSDPYVGVFTQYKAFLYAMNDQIVRRLMHEFKHGNPAALLAIALYVPVALIAELVREGIQYLGTGNPNRKDWGMTDYLWLATERTGLLGPKGELITGVHGDIEAGRLPVSAVVGPTVGQAKNIYAAAIGRRDMGKTFEEALPAAAAWRQWNNLGEAPGMRAQPKQEIE
jgi:hypothetical protein